MPIYIDVGLLPWRLIALPEPDWSYRTRLYVRVDGWLKIPALWTWLRSALRLRLLPIYYRLIYTAEVWDLARVPEGAIPSWRDLGWYYRRDRVKGL